jgi:hypothetical protein
MHHGQSNMPCSPSCKLARVQTFDEQLPVRSFAATSLSLCSLLFLIAPVKINYPAFVSVVRQRDLNVSPPFGGSPPQAVLRLWLI